jgi:Arc/MetJ-type ribon-helix-helix transcriptional regulator
MSFALKPEQQQFIQQQIALGRFESEEAVLEKALQLLALLDLWMIRQMCDL